jgi:hypothetical protein
MKKIRLIFFVLVLFTFKITFSQNVIITGQVKDGNSQNLQYCNISVLNNNKNITGGITDKNGYFYLKVQQGAYKVVINFVGYEPDTINTGMLQSDKFIGVFKLKESISVLEQVEITTSKVVNKIDKDIINITDEEREKASEVTEILDKISGVNYDVINDVVKVDNNANIKILIDNTEKGVDYIKSIDPKKIKQIEVIKYPGGKYGLQNYSAVINIITDKTYRGYSIKIDNMAFIDFDDKNYFYPRNNLNALFSYTYKKVNIYFGVNNMKQIVQFKYNSEYKNDTMSILNNPISNDYNRINKGYVNKFTLGLDYYLNPKNTFSYEIKMQTPYDAKQIQKTNVLNIDNHNDSLMNNYSFISDISANRFGINNSLFYHNTINQNTNLNATYFFDIDEYTVNQDLFTADILSSGSKKTMQTKKSDFNIDFNHNINQKISFNIGGNLKYILSNSNTKYKFNDTIYEFKQQTNINSIYTNLNWQITNKLGIKAGLAYELYNTTTDISQIFNTIQPNAKLSYKLSEKLFFRLSYNVNSRYPSIQETTPVVFVMNNNSNREGNPNLEPAYTHEFNFQAVVFNQLLTLTPYYIFSNNYITLFVEEKQNILSYTNKNIDLYEQKGLKINFNLPIKRIVMISTNFDFYNSYIEYKQISSTLNNWTNNTQISYNSQKLKTGFMLQYQKNYVKTLSLNGYQKGNEMDYLSLVTINHFFKNRLKLIVMYMLPVEFGINYDIETYEKIGNISNYSNDDIRSTKNYFMIKLVYNFSKGEFVKENERRNIVNDEMF